MKTLTYTINLIPAPEGGYTVTVPALRGCVTEGDTYEEAIAMAEDAIRLHVECLMMEGLPVPLEAPAVPTSVALHVQFTEAG